MITVLLSLALSCINISCSQGIQCGDARATNLVLQTVKNNTIKLIESISADKDFASKLLREWIDYRLELANIRTVKIEEGQGKCFCEADLNLSSGTASTTFNVRYSAQFNKRTDQVRVEVYCDQDALYQWALNTSGLKPAVK
jgi:hypothetical protein